MNANLAKNQFGRKITLPYLEFHVTEHCNMNCKGCGHFSCIAEPEFANIDQHIKDMERLSELVNFDILKILGGEPLLHPQINDFMKVTRKFFPKSFIVLLTNAILLPTMPPPFWETVVQNNIAIFITLYKPMAEKKQEFINLLNSHKVRGNIIETTKFFSRLDITGSQNSSESFDHCKVKSCRFLESGKMATCCFPFLTRHLNKKFNLNIFDDDNGIIDIHNPELNAESLIKFLNTPFEMCKYCTRKEEYFDWDFTKKDLLEWIYLDYSILKH